MSEFQIGDVVKVTGNRGEDGNGVPHYFEDGVFATVAEGKDSEGDYYVTNNDETGIPFGQFVNEHNLERLPFQPGEKVLVRTGSGLGAFDGEETKAEVIEFGGWLGDSIEDRRQVVSLNDRYWTQVVLVRDMETLPLFEQGDKVRIIGNGGDRIEHYFTVGDVGEVTSDRDFDGDYLVAVDGVENYVHESHLEKVEETGEVEDKTNDGPEARPCKYGGMCYSCDEPEDDEGQGDRAWTTEFEVGARVRVVDAGRGNDAKDGDTGVVVDKANGHLGGRVLHSVRLDRTGEVSKLFGYRLVAQDEPSTYPLLDLSAFTTAGRTLSYATGGVIEVDEGMTVDIVNNPPHYKFSNGAEVIDITENLTSNGGQAVQYIARSTRLDGNNKGGVLEDLRKARWFIDREIDRVENDG